MSVESAIVGGVTDSRVRIVAKVSEDSSWPTKLSISGRGEVASIWPSAEGVTRFEATGLDADTAYTYTVEDGSDTLDGAFHTHGPVGEPYSFTFAHATCAGLAPTYPGPDGTLAPNRLSNHPVFDEIRAKRPLFFINGGDMPYYDLGSGKHGITGHGAAEYRRQWDDVLACQRQGRLYREVSLVYMWDDHDFGIGNSDRTTPGRAAAAQVYREKFPSYDLPASDDGGVYQSFTVGRVLFLVSDIRYYRDPPGQKLPRTMLGSAQKQWTEQVLANSDAEALVWVNGQRWNTPVNPGVSGWGSYHPERVELAEMLGDTGWLDKMILLHGDQHLLGIDSGANNPNGGFPMCGFAAMDSNFKDGNRLPYDLGSTANRGQYGTVKVTDNGNYMRITATGWVTANA